MLQRVDHSPARDQRGQAVPRPQQQNPAAEGAGDTSHAGGGTII